MDDPLPGITIRGYRPGDERAILAAFNAVFSRGNPRFVPRTLDRWKWEFQDNPAGHRIALAVTEAGEIAAQFCALPVRALFRGRSVTFHQAVDSMSDPRFRRVGIERARSAGGKRSPSLFVRAGNLFVEKFGLSGVDLFGFGLPIPIAWRVGKEFLGYELIRTQLQLVRALDGGGRAPSVSSAAAPDVEEVSDPGEEADRLWSAAAARCEASVVRDATYLRWRYVRHPDLRYRIAVARGADGAPRGVAIYRRGEFSDREQGLLVEWLVPEEDLAAGRALLAWAGDRAREDGADRLATVLPETSRWFAAFQEEGFLAEGTKYILVGRNYLGREGPEWFRAHWSYTLGDFDLA